MDLYPNTTTADLLYRIDELDHCVASGDYHEPELSELRRTIAELLEEVDRRATQPLTAKQREDAKSDDEDERFIVALAKLQAASEREFDAVVPAPLPFGPLTDENVMSVLYGPFFVNPDSE